MRNRNCAKQSILHEGRTQVSHVLLYKCNIFNFKEAPQFIQLKNETYNIPTKVILMINNVASCIHKLYSMEMYDQTLRFPGM